MPKQIVSATPGALIDWNEHKGRLMVVEPLDFEKDIKTVHGESDAVRANVYVLVGPGNTEEYEDTLVFPRALQGQLKRKIGQLVVGRLTQGEAKKGQNPPWQLAEANEKDMGRAKAWTAEHFTESAAPAADEPDDDGWGAGDGDEPAF
jgi:hypothetical protein